MRGLVVRSSDPEVTNECTVSVVVVGELPGKHRSFMTAYKTIYREDNFFNFSTKTLFLFSVQCYSVRITNFLHSF
jgi:hypothetical protein